MSPCPSCGYESAYVGFTSVECASWGCVHFSKRWRDEYLSSKYGTPQSSGLRDRLLCAGRMTVPELRDQFGVPVMLRILREALQGTEAMTQDDTMELQRDRMSMTYCWVISIGGRPYCRDATDPDTWNVEQMGVLFRKGPRS